MAQTYQMKHNPQGTIYSLLTVESDGRMTMTFHGTDREISHEVTENADGWLCYPGGMFPGLESGRWQLKADVQGTVPAVGSEAESERTTEGLSPMCAEPTLRGQSPCNPSSATHTGDSPREPRPRRQRKQRKPRTNNRETSAISQPPSNPPRGKKGSLPREGRGGVTLVDRQPSSTLKALGMVAAASVALFVIYETGLLIPLGLIGLATGGILK